ncbi:hypothetical protein ACQRAS_12325 [Coprococcus catus]
MAEKKRVVVMAGSCYPLQSATGAIAIKCAEIYKNTGKYDVHIICGQEGYNKLNGKTVNGISYHSVGYWLQIILDVIRDRRGKSITGFFFTFMYCIFKVIEKASIFLLHIDSSWWYRKKAKHVLDNMNKEKEISLIVSLCLPIEAHLAASDFKKDNPNCKWICYWADLFATKRNCKNAFCGIRKLITIEYEINKHADIVLVTEEIFDVFRSREYKLSENIIIIPYCLKESILELGSEYQKIGDRELQLVCMGAFYKDLRNPTYMLKSVLIATNIMNLNLNLYTQGQCQEIVDEFVEKSQGKINYYGVIPFEMLKQKMINSDILVNIENNTTEYKPSKLFELMSYRKPIINFRYFNNESVLEPYPMKLEIDMRTTSVENAAKMIVDFCKQKGNHTMLTSDELRALYPNNLETILSDVLLKNVE